ncbi:MAG: thioredoxin domain-containing protein, partial [Euzebyales bacterium]|nr:thioredoxin domain-containing protein [Euzebyales bacterium]
MVTLESCEGGPVPNRLTDASSPYLRQHAGNPVDWYEWSQEAFERARGEDKPVFLSVGYSSCHWCHVMAHESFEDTEVAGVLNDRFVAVKVDREERPDIDSVYMTAVQAMTGQGGWPMSVFLTPDGTPFFGGTYWPRDSRQGMPGFLQVLTAVDTAWRDQRDQVLATGGRLARHLQAANDLDGGAATVDAEVADTAAQLCVRAWDRDFGGFGQAPKFPQAMTIDFLLAHHVRT